LDPITGKQSDGEKTVSQGGETLAIALINGFKGKEFRPQMRRWLLALLLAMIIPGSVGVAESNAQEGTRVLTLEEAYRQALQTHDQILIAEKEVKKANLLPYKAFSMMLPHADAIGAFQKVNKPIESTIGNVVILPHDQTLGGFRVRNSIYNPDFFPQRRKAHEVIDRNINNYFQVIQNILGEVVLKYYQVLRADELVQTSRELIKTAQEEVRNSKVKLASGAVTEDVVLRAELDLAAAENKLIESSNQLRLARSILKNLISLNAVDYTVAKQAPLPEVTENLETLLSKAYDYRFDHKMALAEVDLAKTEIDLVKAKFQPTVDASWDYYAVKHPRFDQESNNWTAMVNVKLPILEGGLRHWELKEKQESFQQAKLSLNDKRRNIRIEVEDSMLAAQNDKSFVLKLQKQVELAQKSYDITSSKFKFGAVTITDVSQAFASLASAKTELINKKYDYQISLLKLNKAEGIFVLDIIRSNSPLSGKIQSRSNTTVNPPVAEGNKDKKPEIKSPAQ
jgi:outer membrane protein